jgi:hypothetical protein
MKKLSLILLLVAGAGIAEASTNTSQVLDVRMNPSTATAGNARVSILLSGTTSCTGGWYAFEYPDSGSGAAMGKAWLASALSALANGRSLTIGGTGACDSFGIETISYIDAL